MYYPQHDPRKMQATTGGTGRGFMVVRAVGRRRFRQPQLDFRSRLVASKGQNFHFSPSRACHLTALICRKLLAGAFGRGRVPNSARLSGWRENLTLAGRGRALSRSIAICSIQVVSTPEFSTPDLADESGPGGAGFLIRSAASIFHRTRRAASAGRRVWVRPVLTMLSSSYRHSQISGSAVAKTENWTPL